MACGEAFPETAARTVGVVPAAGSGTRLRVGPHAWTGAKEVLPVQGRPVVDHLLDRLAAAPCAEVRVVTRPDKRDLREHLATRDVQVVLGEPVDVAASLRLGLAGLADGDVVLSGFPDTLWTGDGGFAELVAHLVRTGADVVLGLFTVPDLRAADEVRTQDDLVLRVVPKPPTGGPGRTWAAFAARVGALHGLDRYAEPGALWDELATVRPGSVQAVSLGADLVDVGTPAGRARAERIAGVSPDSRRPAPGASAAARPPGRC